jgi:comEA protein
MISTRKQITNQLAARAYVWIAAGIVCAIVAAGVQAETPIGGAAARNSAAAATAAHTTVNINTASAEQLQLLPGVGKVIAQRIIEYRAQHGQFQHVTDLRQVKGIGDRKLAMLLGCVSVAGPTTAQRKIRASGYECHREGEEWICATAPSKVGAR